MTNDDFGAPASGSALIENYPSTGEAVTVLVLIAAMFTVIGIFIGWLVFSPPSADFSGRGSMTPWDRTALASMEASHGE